MVLFVLVMCGLMVWMRVSRGKRLSVLIWRVIVVVVSIRLGRMLIVMIILMRGVVIVLGIIGLLGVIIMF